MSNDTHNHVIYRSKTAIPPLSLRMTARLEPLTLFLKSFLCDFHPYYNTRAYFLSSLKNNSSIFLISEDQMNAHTNKNKHIKKFRPRRARRILRTFHFFDRSEILADNPHSPLPFFSDFIRARIIRDSPLPFSPVQSARISARIFREKSCGYSAQK